MDSQAPQVPGPPAPEHQAALKQAWTELTEAAEAAGVLNLQACTRDRTSWQRNPAAVRCITNIIRGLEERKPEK